MFNFIKNILRQKSIAKAITLSKKRTVAVHNFDSAKTVGVVFSCFSDMERLKSVLKNFARKYGLKITVAVYFPQDKLPEEIIQDEYNILFANKECNWFGKPQATIIDNFINNEFNILIDLSLKQIFPLQHIIAASKANFKVGCCNENVNLYDFLLSGSDDEENFLKNIEVYLQKLDLYE